MLACFSYRPLLTVPTVCLYFQLRQSQGASEKFHGAVIDHYGGDDTRVFKEVTEVGEALVQLQEVAGSSQKCADGSSL